MEAQSGNDAKKNSKGKCALSALLGGVILNVLQELIKEGCDLSKVVIFFNSWPIFCIVLCICITAIIIVFILQWFKTIRHKKLKDENENLKNKNETLEKELKDQKDKIMQLQIEMAQKDERIKLLEGIQEEKKADSIADFFGKKRR